MNGEMNEKSSSSATLSVIAFAIALIMVGIPVGVFTTTPGGSRATTISAMLALRYDLDDSEGIMWTRLWVGIACLIHAFLIIAFVSIVVSKDMTYCNNDSDDEDDARHYGISITLIVLTLIAACGLVGLLSIIGEWNPFFPSSNHATTLLHISCFGVAAFCFPIIFILLLELPVVRDLAGSESTVASLYVAPSIALALCLPVISVWLSKRLTFDPGYSILILEFLMLSMLGIEWILLGVAFIDCGPA